MNYLKKNIKQKRSKAGLSMIELLISMAIFGLIIGALNTMLASNGRLTKNQSNSAMANVAVRQSLLRMSDMLSQAHYIYPANQDIHLHFNSGVANKTIRTGASALAFLLPSGSTYCPGATKTYCGYIISVENRDSYEALLGNSAHASNFVLAGWRAEGLVWPIDEVPAASIDSWFDVGREVLADSVNKEATNLAAANRLEPAQSDSIYDKADNFSLRIADKDHTNALIASVSPSLTISYGSNNSTENTKRIAYIFARAIPRGTQPNPE